MSMDEHSQLLHTIAENPGLSSEQLREVAPDTIEELDDQLQRAVDREEVLEMNETFWIVRQGEFAFDEYDHTTKG